jgi:hypothetical protein
MYNCRRRREAGGGTVKAKAFFHVALEDHPDAWTPDDIEFARREANATPRRDLPFSPTPGRLFERREPITHAEREEFLRCYYGHENDARRELGIFEGIELSHQQQSRVDSIALSKALLEKACLQFRRRRRTPTIVAPKVDRTS